MSQHHQLEATLTIVHQQALHQIRSAKHNAASILLYQNNKI